MVMAIELRLPGEDAMRAIRPPVAGFKGTGLRSGSGPFGLLLASGCRLLERCQGAEVPGFQGWEAGLHHRPQDGGNEG